MLQYRHSIPESIDQVSASTWLYKHPLVTSLKRPNTWLTHVACYSKLCSVVYACPENWRQLGVQSCIMPGLPTHQVLELNVGTVDLDWHNLMGKYLDNIYKDTLAIQIRRLTYQLNKWIRLNSNFINKGNFNKHGYIWTCKTLLVSYSCYSVPIGHSMFFSLFVC